MEEEILLAVAEGVATVTLNRPAALNAFTPAMSVLFRETMEGCERDPAVAAIVITGAGRGFCSGMDLSVLKNATSGGVENDGRELPELFGWIRDISKPVIAAVNGAAVGGGFVLAMMSDLRFAAPGAKFSTMFTRRGLMAEHGVSWMLPRQIGLSRALDLILSARTIDAAEAQAMGFADRVIPAEELVSTAQAYAAMLAREVSPQSMAAAKRQVYADLALSSEESAQATSALIWATLGHPDQRESLAAFVEKRAPRFRPWTGGESGLPES